MAGSPADATEIHKHNLQVAISCVCDGIVSLDYHNTSEPRAVMLNGGTPMRLHASPDLYFEMQQAFIVQNDPELDWTVNITSYHYHLLGEAEQEIIGYHWHPDTPNSPIRFPHLHLWQASGVQHPSLVAAHLPTGRVTLEDALRLAITSFGARQLRGDWEAILEVTKVGYEAAP